MINPILEKAIHENIIFIRIGLWVSGILLYSIFCNDFFCVNFQMLLNIYWSHHGH